MLKIEHLSEFVGILKAQDQSAIHYQCKWSQFCLFFNCSTEDWDLIRWFFASDLRAISNLQDLKAEFTLYRALDSTCLMKYPLYTQHTSLSMCVTCPLSMYIHLNSFGCPPSWPYRRGPLLCNSTFCLIFVVWIMLGKGELQGMCTECEECYWLHFQRISLRAASRVTQQDIQWWVRFYVWLQ